VLSHRVNRWLCKELEKCQSVAGTLRTPFSNNSRLVATFLNRSQTKIIASNIVRNAVFSRRYFRFGGWPDIEFHSSGPMSFLKKAISLRHWSGCPNSPAIPIQAYIIHNLQMSCLMYSWRIRSYIIHSHRYLPRTSDEFSADNNECSSTLTITHS
jgi:hypothetical protein